MSMQKNESKILQLPHSFLAFIDEVGDPFVHFDVKTYNNPSIFPVVTILALVVSRKMYTEILMPGLEEIKKYFLGTADIYLHSREIRRKDGIFKAFLDEEKYDTFKKEMDSLIEKSSITIISSSTNKIKLARKAEKFQQLTGNTYNVGDLYLRNVDYVLERLGHFLKNESCKVIFETRGKHESRRIQGVLRDAKENGTFYCPKEQFVGIDEGILFFTKGDNINGLQVADYCTYPFARHAKSPSDSNNEFFHFLRKFVYKGDYWEYGLKEWP